MLENIGLNSGNDESWLCDLRPLSLNLIGTLVSPLVNGDG